MSKKSASDPLSRKMELINKKVGEVNERRRGMKTTYVEDELDRQELTSYMRLLGIEQGNISLESAESDSYPPRDNIFYAILAGECLVEVVLLAIAASYLLSPNPGTLDYILAAVLLGMFGYLGYMIYTSVRNK